jgi:sugar/nucleoside kinase (ribokinase family)
MNTEALRHTLSALHQARVCVVGDVCLDAYWTIDQSRSEESLETSLQTRPVRDQRYYAGGGSNVAMNLQALGVGHVALFGVVGDDPFGGWVCRSLAGAGIDASGILVQPADWATQVFVKPHEGGSELARIDLGNWNSLVDTTRRALLARIESALPSADIVIINEQALRGIHSSPEFRRALLALVQTHTRGRAIIDSRHYIDEFDGVMRKLNAREAARILGETGTPSEYMHAEDLLRLAGRLLDRWRVPVALTAGDRGSVAATEDGVTHIEAVRLDGRLDPVGAGDAFLAGLAGGLSGKAEFAAAARLGTLAAAVTVRKPHRPGTASPEEILALASGST